MKNIYLIIGESGTGKDTVANRLCNEYEMKRVKSYTTRPFRHTLTDYLSHEFISDEEFDSLTSIIAYTEYNGFRYCATQKQVDNADLYIIDTQGIDYFKKHYRGNKGIKIINLYTTKKNRKQRMKVRGDTLRDIKKRLLNDKKAFKEVIADVKIENDDLEKCVKDVYAYICANEREMV